MVTTVEETREQMLRRLADKAREHGVRLRRMSGRYFASSVSVPGYWHYVTGVSCDCIGFHRHQRCMHHAALLSALGWIDGETPGTIEVLPETTCRPCAGTGTVQKHYSRWIGGSKLGYRNEWTTPEPCPDCRGTGHEQAAA